MFSDTSEREAHRYLQDLGKITAAMEAGKITPHQKWYIWRRNLWAINIILRSYLATLPSSSTSPVSFRGGVPYFPSLGAEFTLLSQPESRELFMGYLTVCAHWIDELELLVLQGHASSPERSFHLYLTRYTAKVRNIYQRIESMKTNNLILSTATSSNSPRSPPSPFGTSEQVTESIEAEPDVASMLESLQL
ncbi:hypothetical protein IHE45_08G009700 [Dioscorea alata]|uniref:Uncharacterized protein n=1 Tax=Dioscorea alata TaxID=55571 RepID=A0ACB7VGZ1_DIOAL|nr:hypothetical protein IHE45_08G009700 [Dioscorea alata]